MGIPKGTRLTDSPKDQTIRARMDKETVEKLDYLAEKNHLSRSEIIRNGIEIQYAQENKK